ncbi:hypothetical protein [Lysobacter humi (ex Lee et al. 2017)]
MPLTHEETRTLTQRLLAEHGELIGGNALARCLGYRTQRAFQMGIQRGQVPVETFTLAGRRGRYARTFQVAQWLADCGPALSTTQTLEGDPPSPPEIDKGAAA